MAFVLVQHLDPKHDSALTQLLTRATAMPVREVTHNLRVEPQPRLCHLPQHEPRHRARGVETPASPKSRVTLRAIDSFLEALAHDQHERAIGVILSGNATDGTLGLEAIKAEGGLTFAQDESARHDSMPRSAAAAGCVDFVLSPRNIAKELARIARHPYVTDRASRPDGRNGARGGPGPPRCPDGPPPRGTARARNPTVTTRSCCGCATIPAWISRSTNPPPSTGASPAAWS